jgi:AmmeMemoRadiSam system protein A
MILAGCFDKYKITAELLAYEAPFGVGYASARFTRGESDNTRNFLEQYTNIVLKQAQERAKSEDSYRALARQALEFAVRSGGTLQMPSDLPDELLANKAGVFVSLHKNGRLRGCIGTIAPTTGSVALEIMQNAVSAGLRDNRFEPVTVQELPELIYKVDILSAPEPIAGPEELDVKRYGVIVSSGGRRGLLLPNLDGVDTVDEQLDIAKRKAGIAENMPVKLERFEVVRHE